MAGARTSTPPRRGRTIASAAAPFADLALARRLEAAEAWGSVMFAEAHRRVDPSCGAEWLACGGTRAIFDGASSPITQSFGLGLQEPVTPATLDTVEAFFTERGAPVQHEVCPLAGVATTAILAARGYVPIEISNVLYQEVGRPANDPRRRIRVRVIDRQETALWTDISARGWAPEAPELEHFMRDLGTITVEREQTWCFLAEVDGVPGAAGVLAVRDGVALFAGASTVPELRHRGLQAALLAARMRWAHDHHCDVAMMVAEAGSGSQRNAERSGFRVAYTRTKWMLDTQQSRAR
jgi:GNAT superfamily N-acetyltransferase